jgi:hypothetical protein
MSNDALPGTGESVPPTGVEARKQLNQAELARESFKIARRQAQEGEKAPVKSAQQIAFEKMIAEAKPTTK